MRKPLAKYLVVVAALSTTIGILDRVFPPDQSRYREASLEILAREGEPLRVFTTREGMLRYELEEEEEETDEDWR